MTSAERETNATMIAAINVIGNSVPPMLIFSRVHFKDHMKKGAPPGAIGAANHSGWSNEQHFIQHTKPSPDDPVLLLMDNHESNVSVPTIIKCKGAGMISSTFHPHES
ncbi:hypothetical protein JTB14_000694 [Gonioctena quinquepunctata]|nr:hypothetical protein JTB14_000694 [Gonioctena quinquepunctata]